ncbi:MULTISPECIES: hypothetical protein [Nostoc]|uniref:Uncharacterized protein n=2 Tax=Nostoc TaxID=1177 RepID=A0ABR8I3K0_9NOSO|nr:MULTISPECIES: hypothetical protein [Nostoc]MBD2560992.1 hypothetical protein [Nostoc linckia FACHB-391]MBD2646193.1 hypothetical protein [Nostoc foliaceum FACHB-393]
MRKQTQLLSKSNVILLAENTKMRKQTQLLSKPNGILLAGNTEMRKQTQLLSKSNVILLIKFDLIYFFDALTINLSKQE